MNIKENAMAVYHGEEPSRIPWLIYEGLCPRGYMARQLQNKGLGLKVSASVMRVEMPHVNIETNIAGNIVHRTFHTPVGDLSMKERIGLQEGAGGSWIVEYPVKNVKDFEIYEFVAEDTNYIPDSDPLMRAGHHLDADGITFVWAGRSPLQEMQIELMGYKTFATSFFKYPTEFNMLFRTLEKRADERYGIIAESPAEIVNGTDNINSEIVNPKLFERYFLPFYSKQAQRLHRKDKVLEDHMDGKLKLLKDLIAKMEVDVVEAFTPPPMGDLPLIEARKAWKDKIISLNFPESVFLEGIKSVKKHTLKFLSETAPGGKFIVTVTEDIPKEYHWSGLKAITNVLGKHGVYPISKDIGVKKD